MSITQLTQDQANQLMSTLGRGKTFDQLSKLAADGVLSATEMNEVFGDLMNLMVMQGIIKTLNFDNKLLKKFFYKMITAGNSITIIDTDIPVKVPYDRTKYIPTPQTIRDFSKTIVVDDKGYFQIEISMEILAGAFVNLAALNEFIALVRTRLEQGFLVDMYKKMGPYIIDPAKGIQNIQNTKKYDESDKNSLIDYITQVYNIGYAMSLPTDKYNAIPVKTGANKVNALISTKDLIMITNSHTKSVLVNSTLATTFNERYINLESSFGEILLNDYLADGEILLITADAYKVVYRINTYGSQS
ncbi:MAG: hypothetical protein ACRCXT_19005 [Paraclostridium sp.]